MIGYSNKTCPGCNSFEPYFITQGGITISNIADDIEIASSASQQFAIDMKNIWSRKGYDSTLPSQAQQKVLDIRQDYGVYLSMVIGMVDYYGVGPVFDISTVLLGYDPVSTLPLTPTQRLFTFIGACIPRVGGAALANGNKLIETTALKYGLEVAEVLKLSDELALAQYNPKTIQDVVDKKLILTFERVEQNLDGMAGTYKASKIANILADIEVQNTITRIKSGVGKYTQDGVEFMNDGRGGGQLLPTKSQGYYKEWTVDTPGITTRGPRRIINGSNGEMYFTDDHYAMFTKIK